MSAQGIDPRKSTIAAGAEVPQALVVGGKVAGQVVHANKSFVAAGFRADKVASTIRSMCQLMCLQIEVSRKLLSAAVN
ncbi:hypothetical protein HDU84_008192, partial [Entophlyctis sp. JEL0112]